MILLVPLGLLALLSILALLLIYILKPNYQQKRLTSTFVWKLSLLYKRKRIPISKIRNLIIIFCQVLILASCAFALSQPNQILSAQIDYVEVVAIIDSSASMRTTEVHETRYERAVYGVIEEFKNLPQDGVLSVIIADANPYLLLNKVRPQNADALEVLNDLLIEDSCSYGSSDIDSAMVLCEDILKENPDVQIKLYTDIEYSYSNKAIKIVPVSQNGEWNVSILNAHAQIEQNYYVFYVDVACYGKDYPFTLNLQVQNVNSLEENSGQTVSFETTVSCNNDITQTIIFKYFIEGEEVPVLPENHSYCFIEYFGIFSFESVHISLLNVQDSFAEDNSFEIYGGKKEPLKIQYASAAPNGFLSGFLFVLNRQYQDRWDVQINEVKKGDEPALDGYDFYIFEHTMPLLMPNDGVVFLINPDIPPIGSGFSLASNPEIDFRGKSMPLTEENKHPITSKIPADKITISKYMHITDYDSSYKVLMSCDTNPVFLLKDEVDSKVAILSFNLHYSNIPTRKELPLLLLNMFEYFLPTTVVGNAFEVYDNISLKSRGQELSVKYNDRIIEEFNHFPATLSTSMPGTYLLEQTTFSLQSVSEKIYVKIPAIESNIWLKEDALPNPYRDLEQKKYHRDLLFIIMAVLVGVLFLERLLHLREEI